MPTPIPVNPDLLLALADPAYAGMADADAAVAISARPPVARPGPVNVTYLFLDTLPAPLGGNAAGDLRTGLEAWRDGIDLSTLNPVLPNRGRLSTLHSRLAGYPGVDLTAADAPSIVGLLASGVPGVHPPLLTPAQAAALLSLGYVVQGPVTADDVAAARAALAQQAAERADNAVRDKIAAAAAGTANEYARQPGPVTAAGAVADLAARLAAAGVA